jgi:HTH-type transcriptional regulator/antitoxin HigA
MISIHPGELIKEYIEHFKMTCSQAAHQSGIDEKLLEDICAGCAPVTQSVADALSVLFHRPAHFWMNLQKNFDKSNKEQMDGDEI